jgi:hypothetical protein
LLTRRIPLRTTTVRAGTAHRPALADNIGARLAHGRDDPFDVDGARVHRRPAPILFGDRVRNDELSTTYGPMPVGKAKASNRSKSRPSARASPC